MLIKLIVFDLDGTLFTSGTIVHLAYQKGVEEFNRIKQTRISVPSSTAILGQIGNPGKVIYKTLFPGVGEKLLPELGHTIRKHLIEDVRHGKGRLFPGVRETLAVLSDSGYQLRVASNGHKDYVEAVLVQYGLSALFGPPVFLNSADLRDKGDIINLYKSILGVASGETVMVGDRGSDREAAQKAGCHFIGITMGHGGKDEIDGPDALLADRFEDIPLLLAKINISSPILPEL
jgi:phosphoglycolate phosphatase